MYLYRISIEADREIVERFKGGFVARFGRDTCCITLHLSKLIWRKIKTEKTQVLHFVFTDLIDSPPSAESPLPTSHLIWPFDFSNYLHQNELGKKSMILDTLVDGLHWVFRHTGWPVNAINEAVQTIRTLNYNMSGLAKRSWASPSGQFRVRLFYRLELDALHVESVLFNRTGKVEIARKLLCQVPPDDDCLNNYLSDGCWISETQFQLRSKGWWDKKWVADFSQEIDSHLGKL